MFDINKPYTMRWGGKAQAIAGPDGRLFGWVQIAEESPRPYCWFADGRVIRGRESSDDLINVPEKRTVKVWINVYAPGSNDGDHLVPHMSLEDAQDCSAPGRIACIEREITYTVGEGL